MAIKGKGKTRPRRAPRPPRHEPVHVKPPFFARGWVQVTGAFVLGFLAMMFLVWVTNGLREQNRIERSREREAAELQRTRGIVQDWAGVVDTQVGTIGQVTGPGLPPTLLPAASAVIDGVAAGDDVKGASATLDEAEADLATAVETLDAYELLGKIRNKGFDVPQTNYLLNSKTKLLEGLRNYRHAVVLARRALSGGTGLGKIAADLRDGALTLVAGGWRDLEQVKQSVGINPLPEAAAS
jgi:hypothetical protein